MMMGLIDDVQNGVVWDGPFHPHRHLDEAHCSVYRTLRDFYYFDSLLLGLTATPRDEIYCDTYSLFELERGVPTDSFDLDEAVAGGFLLPRAVSVPLRVQREGIRDHDLSDEDKEAWDAIEWDEDGEFPRASSRPR